MSSLSINRDKNHRFPAEIISHGVWPYFRSCLSYHDVEDLLFARGIIMTYAASANGAGHLGSRMPISCGTAAPNLEISGTSMQTASKFLFR
jgi:transposase-like protein